MAQFMDIKGAAGRFDGVTRPYTEQDVQRLRGSVKASRLARCRSSLAAAAVALLSRSCPARCRLSAASPLSPSRRIDNTLAQRACHRCSRPLSPSLPFSASSSLLSCDPLQIENTLAQRGADTLWELLKAEPYVHALGALSGNQARRCSLACCGPAAVCFRALATVSSLPRPSPSPRSPTTLTSPPCFPPSCRLFSLQAVQMAKAGLKAIYLSGWQVCLGD